MQGQTEEVASYCESDVMATYLIYLRLGLVTGELQPTCYQKSLEDLANFLSQRIDRRPHLTRFVDFLSRPPPNDL
jgi:predicted PolB exonuclease-like 3'-5' exonuclease